MESDLIEGGRNVFADLQLSDAAERQTRKRRAMAVSALVTGRWMKQAESAVLLGIPKRQVSGLVNYRLDHFSVERLMRCLNALDQDVEIVIRPRWEAVGQVSVLGVS